ncbi:MAG: 16S rRNA (guanine(966)-N(2))-methyltransferase RsmD [Endomicrobia bacterium]|nr:16S rRNA (guanine(966)-N(2))-methyltransferase RsmD [Endomicrobiia bacterium]
MIKIIAGEFKGRLLKTPKNIRPILAQIKKSVFDILTPYLNGCLFLDLYAGSGAVGIEALSRGAKFCVFVEKERDALQVLSQNVVNLNCQDMCYVIKADILKDLFWVEKSRKILYEQFGRKSFDIIFVGAPYVEKDKTHSANLCVPTLELIANSSIIANNGHIVVQHSKRETVASDKFKLERTKHYGDTIVSFFVKN